MEQSSKNLFVKSLLVIVIAAWALWTLNSGLYVDENGLLTIYKGINQGQHMFVDSWESLQTGGFLAWPLFALYYDVFKPMFETAGINIGLVLLMRIAYMIVRALVAIYLYFTIRKTAYEDGAYYGALFYFLFVVTWKNFSYKSYCEIAVMLILCFLIRYHESRNVAYFVLTGIAASIAILAYPTMLILAVVIGVIIIWKMYSSDIGIMPLILFVTTCVICGIAFLTYLQLTSGIPEALSQLKYLGDQDYEENVFVRFGKILISYAAFGVVAYIPVVLINLFKRIINIDDYLEKGILSLYWFVFLLAVCFLKVDSISNSRFIYALILVYFWFPYLIHERSENGYTVIGAYNNTINSEKEVLWLMFTMSTAAQFVWAVSTNQDISVPGHMAVYAAIAVILLLCTNGEMLGLVRLMIISAVFFLCFWVAEGNGGYSDILKERWIVTEGELKGIALLPEDYKANQSVYNLVTNYVSKDDKLLVAFGSNSTGYLNCDAKQGTYSVYARTQKNTKLLEYYEINPDNQADYVLIDTSNVKYQDFMDGEVGKYIMENYTAQVAKDGDFVLWGR
ncbi:Dolichyl-phosphate-mannose-protein mannosyltransferase [Pseudobutyrivibrio sp. ACV-2]|uniref:glycosyltransferase family 39 protein n=1 Tax=Pseudobutyrivibrio sp. ACV-2 TaxID=1520801 RepID=UPI00089B8BDE|nr:glycosyltransferase family 39 protein [Pseudobutyrivibrio sp. ACV-2]SEA52501.1 Dolichyl-phosphate-mannose-protein mannosyltransferase [Pseudobutyrivibrio sp. ACV-2]